MSVMSTSWTPLYGNRGFLQASTSRGMRLPLVTSIKQQALGRVRESMQANLSSKTVTTLSVTDLSASFTRRILQIIPSIGPKHSSVTGLSCLSCGIGLLIGSAVTIGNGIADLKKAQEIGDREGVRRAGPQIVSGVISTNISALSLAKITATTALSMVGPAADLLSGFGALLNIGISGWGVYRASIFRSRLNGHLESKYLNEKERILKTLEFLKNKATPTEKEKEAIVHRVDRLYPLWDAFRKHSEVKRQILDLAEVKIKYIKRRTCQGTAEKLVEELDQHLDRLRSEKADVQCLSSSKELISDVKKQNMKKMLLSFVVVGTSLMAFIALIIGSFFSLGAIPFVLYAMSSVVALSVLLYPLIAENLHKSKARAMETRAIALAPTVLIASES